MHSIRGCGTRLLIWIIATREKKTPYLTTIPHAKRADVLVKVSNLLFGNSYAPQETTHHTGRTGPSTGPHPDAGRNNAFTSSCRDVMAQPEDFLPEDFPGDHQKPFPPPRLSPEDFVVIQEKQVPVDVKILYYRIGEEQLPSSGAPSPSSQAKRKTKSTFRGWHRPSSSGCSQLNLVPPQWPPDPNPARTRTRRIMIPVK